MIRRISYTKYKAVVLEIKMNEILKAIPVMFNQRKPVNAPPRIDITEMAIRRTNRQFEQAFVEVTSHVTKQKSSNK